MIFFLNVLKLNILNCTFRLWKSYLDYGNLIFEPYVIYLEELSGILLNQIGF